jgi:hypothetical protein
MRRLHLALLLLTAGVLPSPARADEWGPDPRSVQRYGPAYRYPQAGWIVLHIEGEPYERGCQHGRLLAPEIAAHVRCFASVTSSKAPSDGWKAIRTLVNSLFLRRYHPEYLTEMKGIADGASAAGARFDNRPIDLLDIVALNSWAEVETLETALEATPTGLEGVRFPQETPRAMPRAKPMHCSAFAANGKATRDGKIVFGHITMFSLYPSNFYNVWLDVKPTRGHRVFMQTYPGGIQSGMDYYFNDAGLLVCETTIAQTRFDNSGLTIASRIRQTLQYADSIDKAVDILKEGNNGLYTNEWLLADTKTNEIAMFELGTQKSKLYRSSKGDWYGGTEGFYWGCNNTKDLQVRLETIASPLARPANPVFRPSERDKKWLALYDQYQGRIDAEFAKLAFTTPPLAAYHSLDAKFTTTDLARGLKTWALFGPPLGRSWKPTLGEHQRYPDIQPLASNPWTILHPTAPKSDAAKVVAVDLPNPEQSTTTAGKVSAYEPPPTVPAWHGTVLPTTDADVWLATGFANYERIVGLENAFRKRASDGQLTKDDREHLAVALFAHRADYELGARAGSEKPLALTQAEVRHNDWYRVASGKGVLLLHSLRRQMGTESFDGMMEAFGRDHAGKDVTTAQFQTHVEEWVANQRTPFFEPWLKSIGLPRYQLGPVTATHTAKGYEVNVEVQQEKPGPHVTIDVTVETDKGELTRGVRLDGTTGRLNLETGDMPVRVIVDKYSQTAKGNGGPFSVLSFLPEVEQTLIVYGTADERAGNLEAAEKLQQAIVQRGSNFTVPMKADEQVTVEDLKSHHVILIGRPDSNSLVKRFQEDLPISFGPRHFVVQNEVYAHTDSAVLAAAENPVNKRYSLVVVAGLSAASTLRTAPALVASTTQTAEVVVLPHGAAVRSLIIPAKDLVCEVKVTEAAAKRR